MLTLSSSLTRKADWICRLDYSSLIPSSPEATNYKIGRVVLLQKFNKVSHLIESVKYLQYVRNTL